MKQSDSVFWSATVGALLAVLYLRSCGVPSMPDPFASLSQRINAYWSQPR